MDVSGQLHVPAFLPPRKNPPPIEQETGQDLDLFWVFCSGEKSLVPASWQALLADVFATAIKLCVC